MDSLLKLSDFETAAGGILHKAWFDYYVTGSGDLYALHANQDAYAELRIHYRVFRDVSRIDLSCDLLGDRLPHPIIAAPTAFHCLANPEGEVATVTGLDKAGALMTLSSLSTRLLEDVSS